MRIQPITPSFTARPQQIQNNTNIIKPQPMKDSMKALDVQTPSMQKMQFNWFPSIFSSKNSKEMNEVKNIKDENGFNRYDKEDLKEIKKHLKNDEISVGVLKDFAPTRLNVKSMSEVYLFSKSTKNPEQEQKHMLKAITEFEKPEMKMPRSYKEYCTQVSREKGKMYEIKNHDGSHIATYKANGEKIGESRITAGPYHPSPSSSSSSSSDDSSSTRNDDWDDWRNPMNPLSPFNPINM